MRKKERLKGENMKRDITFGKYFCGNEISEYGRQNGRVDYATLAKSFDAVLANGIIEKTYDIGYWELENGTDYDEEDDYYYDIFQYFIISGSGAQILEDYTDEIVYYNEELDMYVWGVTHWGTSWDYVLTDIKCEKEGGAE